LESSTLLTFQAVETEVQHISQRPISYPLNFVWFFFLTATIWIDGNDIFHVYGGRVNGVAQSDLWQYNQQLNQWRRFFDNQPTSYVEPGHPGPRYFGTPFYTANSTHQHIYMYANRIQ